MARDSLAEDEITLDENRNLAEGVESQNLGLLVLTRHQIDRLSKTKRSRVEQRAGGVGEQKRSSGSRS